MKEIRPGIGNIGAVRFGTPTPWALSELRAQMGSNAGQWVLAATERVRLRREAR